MPRSEFAIHKTTLDSERFKLVREIFLDAQRFRGAARQAFLLQRCGGDPSLHKQVADLLKHDDSDTSVLDRPVIQTVEDTGSAPRAKVGRDPVGRFKLLQVLGEGSSGVTSLAQNPDAKSRRAVVKIIHAKLAALPADAADAVSRIQVDHRSLAALRQHPSARLLDCARFERGGLYIATDFIPGEPILQYCDRVRASIRSRLLLFLDACEAVAAAHQCGVIHAGLTPGNAIVRMAGDVPTVMISDFGVARALHDLLGQRRAWIEARLAHGAVEYLAPEQAADEPRLAESASDVYSLGALLYELLTGVAPFDRFALRRAGMGDFPRILAEQTVLEPVDRLAELGDRSHELAERRSCSAPELRAQLAGDLGSIPMKALCKSATARHPSASALSDEVRGFLDGKPNGTAPGLRDRMRRIFGRLRDPQ